jgi:hypothetical protein
MRTGFAAGKQPALYQIETEDLKQTLATLGARSGTSAMSIFDSSIARCGKRPALKNNPSRNSAGGPREDTIAISGYWQPQVNLKIVLALRTQA